MASLLRTKRLQYRVIRPAPHFKSSSPSPPRPQLSAILAKSFFVSLPTNSTLRLKVGGCLNRSVTQGVRRATVIRIRQTVGFANSRARRALKSPGVKAVLLPTREPGDSSRFGIRSRTRKIALFLVPPESRGGRGLL